MELSPKSALAELRRLRIKENRRNRAVAAAVAKGKTAPRKRVRLSAREEEAAVAAIALRSPAATPVAQPAPVTDEPPLLLADASPSAPAVEKPRDEKKRKKKKKEKSALACQQPQ